MVAVDAQAVAGKSFLYSHHGEFVAGRCHQRSRESLRHFFGMGWTGQNHRVLVQHFKDRLGQGLQALWINTFGDADDNFISG
ncbi:hypothetical protein SDC9_161585 [bioreactor metagenome]|uniref:Uncharacterized protein n=1 Tax=bioreactor metagenome TaxID=1076179 RepID=A0A645FLP1_9ZZZZ